MIDVVFISDLHLHPEETAIQERFDAFIDWAKKSVKKVYILGDLFHAWVGDDEMNDWSRGIARQIHSLTTQGIAVFFLHGNRDFLIGSRFTQLAGWTVVTEPALVEFGKEQVLLMHGDSYCTKDISHQRFRLLTRNKLFSALFLRLPLQYRINLAHKMRQRSMLNQNKPMEVMDVVPDTVIRHMQQQKTATLIHGHTHKPGLTSYTTTSRNLKRFVLSDWDDNPQILCYDISKGFHFTHL